METTHNGNSSSGVSGDEGCLSSVASFGSEHFSSSYGDDDPDPDYPEWAPQYDFSESQAGPSKPNYRISHAKPYKVNADTNEKRYRNEHNREQNRNACTRFRQRRKVEVDAIYAEEKVLMAENDRLRGKIEGVLCKIRFVKGLIRELSKTKEIHNLR